MIALVIVLAVILFIGVQIKKKHDKYKDIPGISLLEFFKDASNLPLRTAKYYREKLARIDTPVITMVLATHPDSAKVTIFLDFYWLILIF